MLDSDKWNISQPLNFDIWKENKDIKVITMCFTNRNSVGREVFFQVIQKPCFSPCPCQSAKHLASTWDEREKGHRLFFFPFMQHLHLFQVWPGTRKQITLECSGGVAFLFTFFLQFRENSYAFTALSVWLLSKIKPHKSYCSCCVQMFPSPE